MFGSPEVTVPRPITVATTSDPSAVHRTAGHRAPAIPHVTSQRSRRCG